VRDAPALIDGKVASWVDETERRERVAESGTSVCRTTTARRRTRIATTRRQIATASPRKPSEIATMRRRVTTALKRHPRITRVTIRIVARVPSWNPPSTTRIRIATPNKSLTLPTRIAMIEIARIRGSPYRKRETVFGPCISHPPRGRRRWPFQTIITAANTTSENPNSW